MDLGEHGRSACHYDRYAGLETRVCVGWAPTVDDVRWLLDGIDVLYTAETWYRPEVPHEAKRAGVKTVMHVMPELYRAECAADEIWVPTSYKRGSLPANRLVPVPVALDRHEYRRRSPARHFVHVWAPAMKDRNGTIATLAALSHVRRPIKLTALGAQHAIESEGKIEIDVRPPFAGPYFDIWPEDGDVLVLPRRYAGLSMPAQEAAARGMTLLMTDVEPQKVWPIEPVKTRGRPDRTIMAGGPFDVHDPDPIDLARAIERLASSPKLAGERSDAARRWARGLSWDVWRTRYQALFEAL